LRDPTTRLARALPGAATRPGANPSLCRPGSRAGIAHVRRAGILYSWALRYLVLVAPIVASLLHPFAGPPAALLLVLVLYRFDRVGAGSVDDG